MNKFEKLYTIDVNHKVEKKNGLNYLSWAYAWAEFKKAYPDATYKVVKNPDTNLPYFNDEKTGYTVFTEVTADGLTHEMWLFVMDGANKAMKSEPYTYEVKDWQKSNAQNKTVMMQKSVHQASMFDINKTIMRCLVKNLAMFGLGLYIYEKESFPEQIVDTTPKEYEQDKFDKNYPKWVELVKSGEKKAETIISLMDNFNLSDEQMNKMIELKGLENAK